MSPFDFRLGPVRVSLGLVIAAALLVAALAGLFARGALRRPSGLVIFLSLGLAVGVGALLVSSATPRIRKALQQLAFAAPPSPRPGPIPAAVFSAALASDAGGPPIIADVWYPSGEAPPPAGGAPRDCQQATKERRLSQAAARLPILLYAPGGGSRRDDNASTAATLAGHGYVVMTIDDLERDPPQRGAGGARQPVEPLAFDFSSDEASAKTLKAAARKTRLEAEKALAALDRLKACAGADWRTRLDFDRVGFFGFSFGGAVAAEAGAMDDRIVAVANLDGWLFGQAASGALDKPYMVMNDDESPPAARQLQSADPRERNIAALNLADLREQVRLASRPDGYWILIKGSRHEGFADQIFDRQYAANWLAVDPLRMKEICDGYLLAFFDAYLRNERRPLLRREPSPYGEVELLGDSAHRMGDALATPISK